MIRKSIAVMYLACVLIACDSNNTEPSIGSGGDSTGAITNSDPQLSLGFELDLLSISTEVAGSGVLSENPYTYQILTDNSEEVILTWDSSNENLNSISVTGAASPVTSINIPNGIFETSEVGGNTITVDRSESGVITSTTISDVNGNSFSEPLDPQASVSLESSEQKRTIRACGLPSIGFCDEVKRMRDSFCSKDNANDIQVSLCALYEHLASVCNLIENNCPPPPPPPSCVSECEGNVTCVGNNCECSTEKRNTAAINEECTPEPEPARCANFPPVKARIGYYIGNEGVELIDSDSITESYLYDDGVGRDSLQTGDIGVSLALLENSALINASLETKAGPGFAFYGPTYRTWIDVLIGYEYDGMLMQELTLSATDSEDTPGNLTRKSTNNTTQVRLNSGDWERYDEKVIPDFQTGQTEEFSTVRTESFVGNTGEPGRCSYVRVFDFIDTHTHKSWNFGEAAQFTNATISISVTPLEPTN